MKKNQIFFHISDLRCSKSGRERVSRVSQAVPDVLDVLDVLDMQDILDVLDVPEENLGMY